MRPLALVTGASSGIGFELAKLCSARGYDLVIVANEIEINEASTSLGNSGSVQPIEADLATTSGIEKIFQVIGDRPIHVLMANAGAGMKGAYLDQTMDEIRHTIETNVTGTLHVVHHVAKSMLERRAGKILITGSIAGFMPGPYNAVYNASKAFIDSFSYALREELADTGVTVTCLMPGATETKFFDRAQIRDTKLGQANKDDPAFVARQGFDAMIAGDAQVVTGWMNKVVASIANVTPATLLAKLHKAQAQPGSGRS
jgi:uncharacterized protein